MALSKIKTNSKEDNAVSTGKIVDGTIANADVSPSAAIAQSKVNNLAPQISSLCTTATSVSADVGAVQNNIGNPYQVRAIQNYDYIQSGLIQDENAWFQNRQQAMNVMGMGGMQ